MKTIQVKTWIVTLNGEKAEKFEILAPTKFLAKLNFQQDYGWIAAACVKSIVVARKK